MGERARSFGTVAGAGLLSATVTAWAAHRDWAVAGAGDAAAMARPGTSVGQVPLAGALALATLAAWGVLLVTRGRWRRGVAWLAAGAAAATLAVSIAGAASVRAAVVDHLRDDLSIPGATAAHTASMWVALATAAICVVASLAAALTCRDWPEMGSAYDAPGSRSDSGSGPGGLDDADPREIWRALDEGHDPTSGPRALD